jgi:hypothetical protein
MIRNQLKLEHLGFFGEAVGVLSKLARDDGFLIARIGEAALVLPLEIEGKLQPLLGTRLGILHTDIPGKEYLVCSIPSDSVNQLSEANQEAKCYEEGA